MSNLRIKCNKFVSVHRKYNLVTKSYFNMAQQFFYTKFVWKIFKLDSWSPKAELFSAGSLNSKGGCKMFIDDNNR